MDGEDENTTYLSFLSDGPHNYLLNNNGDDLSETFPEEPMFTEVDPSSWSTASYPILLNGAFITDESSEVSDNGSNKIEFLNQNEVRNLQISNTTENNSVAYTIESPLEHEDYENEKNVVIPRDLLIHLNSNIVNQSETVEAPAQSYLLQCNGNSYTVVFAEMENDGNESPEVSNAIELNEPTNAEAATATKTLLDSLEPSKNTLNSGHQAQFDYKSFFSTITAVKCKVCSLLFETEVEIVNHLKTEHSDLMHSPVIKDTAVSTDAKLSSLLDGGVPQLAAQLFMCGKCRAIFNRKDELKIHMIKTHIEKPMCDTSKESEDSDSKENKTKMSIKHLAETLIRKQQKILRKVKCSIKGCNLRFARDDLRKRHEECHVSENKKQYKCPECEQKFSLWRICNNHLWKCHKIDLNLITCPMCNDFKSSSKYQVINHMYTHNEDRPYLCSACGKRFKTLLQLRNHSVIHKLPDEVPNWSTPKQCDKCERYFANGRSLKKHIQSVHDKFKPFICNICGHKTARKAMLELHLRQHTGDKPHQCDYCNYRTGDHNCLRRHIMRHLGDTKYSCPHCDYQSIQSFAYKKHLASKHPGESGTYGCSYCSYTTVNPKSYFAHITYHQKSQKKDDTAGNPEHSTGSNEDSANNTSNASKIGGAAPEPEDDETQAFFSNEHSNDIVDTGGITIPAGFEMQLVT